jgi:hypothetical protein
MPAPLSLASWRIFRLWLNGLDDDPLFELRVDADMEASARLERDQSIDRLFLGSLSDEDLLTAGECIEDELDARAVEDPGDRRATGGLPAPSGAKTRAVVLSGRPIAKKMHVPASTIRRAFAELRGCGRPPVP